MRPRNGVEREEVGEAFISSMPLSELVRCLDPAPPQRILDAANALSYRDFLTVVLIIGREHTFPDNWIYIHSPDVRVGRVQNFKQWSPEMVPDSTKTSLGLEYFVHEGDDLWSASDEELLARGEREMVTLGLIERGERERAAGARGPAVIEWRLYETNELFPASTNEGATVPKPAEAPVLGRTEEREVIEL